MDRQIDPNDLTSDDHLLRRWWVWLHAPGTTGRGYLVAAFWDKADADAYAEGGANLVVSENKSAPAYS